MLDCSLSQHYSRPPQRPVVVPRKKGIVPARVNALRLKMSFDHPSSAGQSCTTCIDQGNNAMNKGGSNPRFLSASEALLFQLSIIETSARPSINTACTSLLVPSALCPVASSLFALTALHTCSFSSKLTVCSHSNTSLADQHRIAACHSAPQHNHIEESN